MDLISDPIPMVGWVVDVAVECEILAVRSRWAKEHGPGETVAPPFSNTVSSTCSCVDQAWDLPSLSLERTINPRMSRSSTL
jgi:hypothetical protein